MKIEIPRDDLLGAVSTVAGVVERRQTLPILANVLLETDADGLRLATTDLEIAIGTWVGTMAVAEPGAVTIPTRKLMDFCRSLREGAKVSLRTDKERCIVSSGRTRFTLSTLPAADFPSIAAEGEMRHMQLASVQLKRLLNKTAFAMAQQDVRYYLNGVLLELGQDELIAVATDGHRLSRFSVDAPGAAGDETEQLILPAKTVAELRRLLDNDDAMLEFRWGERSLVVALGKTVLSSKLVDGKYPEYQRVIPKGLPRRAVVDRDLIRTALQRAAILSNEKYKGVRITFEDGMLRLQAQNPEQEVAEDEVEADYAGDAVTIGFNVGYLIDALQAIEADQVEVAFQDADSSSIWRGLNCEDETFVVMPMRL
ncbi:MAG: DNA polymerase III subunit beta [Thiohalocapsa sp.]|uniref:DNA polymerase III subunit beta n=1 Tax=Thiohalocapsa sp. TaxID=2497641 RepID=UPI0025F4A856|nr:DNA polymerase III subunit beta [Thiohalocapsa sp.]